MTLKELITITDETINIMRATNSLTFRTKVALTISDGLLATDGALSKKFLDSEVTSIAVGTDNSLCVEIDYKVED